jgi:hypothetical protein
MEKDYIYEGVVEGLSEYYIEEEWLWLLQLKKNMKD